MNQGFFFSDKLVEMIYNKASNLYYWPQMLYDGILSLWVWKLGFCLYITKGLT